MNQRIVFIGDSITWWGISEGDDIGTKLYDERNRRKY
jgi:hypothetical protein